MLLEEAIWIRDTLASFEEIGSGMICADVGSCSEHYRTVIQPHITSHVYKPLRKRNVTMLSLDIQADKGVDVVWDVTAGFGSSAFLTEGSVDIAIAASLLEHVADRRGVICNLLTLLKSGGFLVVTVPHVFPYHAHPVDTKFRPTPKELENDFKDHRVDILKSCLVEARGTQAASSFLSGMGQMKNFLLDLITFTPRELSRREPFWVTCLILRKQ